ncbi:MAG: endonuclease, partial [Planctomycetota bacterium]
MKSFVVFVAFFLCSTALTANPPAGYYDNATGTGSTLKSQLHTIIRTGHQSISYNEVRSQMRDGTLELPPDGTGVLLVYDGEESTSSAWPNWNREHLWPRSRGVGENQSSSGFAHNDLHALRACDAGTNSSRGNRPFGTSSSEWDPDDLNTRQDMSFRGQVARSLFYMATRYEGTDGDGSSDLELATFAGSNTMGDIRELVRWHYEYLPGPWERQRHEKVASIHNNRNPFIDHPEWVWTIWGVPNFGQNNSQVYVGTGPGANGSSGIFLEFGSFILGGTVTPKTATVNKTFDHPAAVAFDVPAEIAVTPQDQTMIFPFGSSTIEIEV